MVRRQRLVAHVEFEGKSWKITVTRDFVASALLRRSISDQEFHEFVQREHGIITLLAKRKIVKTCLRGDHVLIDRYDLPE